MTWNNDLRSNLVQRNEDKGAIGQPRVGNLKARLVDLQIA